jgi:hypothetical protein
LYSYILFCLNISTNPDIYIGVDRWLFIKTYLEHTQDDLLKGPLLSPDQNQKVHAYFKKQHDLSESMETKFVFMIAADKETVYPEYVCPDCKTPAITLADQVIEIAKSEGITVLDMRPIMKKEKENNPSRLLYYKQGSHWNSFGAVIGYRELMKTIGLTGVPSSDYKIISDPGSQDDLRALLGLDKKESSYNLSINDCSSNNPILFKSFFSSIYPQGILGNDLKTNTHCAVHNKKVVVFRDSFFEGMTMLFSQTFTHSSFYQRKTPDEQIKTIEQEHPDIIILEIVERNLISLYF